MAQTVRYPYHGTLNGGTGHKRTQPGALTYILSGYGLGGVVGSTLTGIPGARTLTGPQERQKYRAVGAYRQRQAQIAAFSGLGVDTLNTGVSSVIGTLAPCSTAPPMQPPPIGALNVYTDQILAYVACTPRPKYGHETYKVGELPIARELGYRQHLLESYAVALLKHAATLHDKPNWAESYVEATYPLADRYIEYGKAVAHAYARERRTTVQIPPGLTRDGVLKRWRERLLPAKPAQALAVAVPQTFRNTATPAGTTDPRAVPAAPAPAGGAAKGGGLGLFALLAAGAAYWATR
jgi:hypothetical protein